MIFTQGREDTIVATGTWALCAQRGVKESVMTAFCVLSLVSSVRFDFDYPPSTPGNDFPFKIIVYEKSINVACLLLKFGEIFLVQKYFSRTIHFTYKHLHQNKMHLFDYEQVKSRNVSSSVFFSCHC